MCYSAAARRCKARWMRCWGSGCDTRQRRAERQRGWRQTGGYTNGLSRISGLGHAVGRLAVWAVFRPRSGPYGQWTWTSATPWQDWSRWERRPAAMRCSGGLERCGCAPGPVAAGRRSNRVAARRSRSTEFWEMICRFEGATEVAPTGGPYRHPLRVGCL
jgi:hypothetical protein